MSEDAEPRVALEELQRNQEVHGSDGEKIGEVEGITVDQDTGEQYLEVAVGLFKMLYVPKHEVVQAVLGQPVRLKVTGSEAQERFTTRPNIL